MSIGPSADRFTGLIAALLLAAVVMACKSSGGILGPKDETAEAAELVKEANVELTKIKELYVENEGDINKEGKREQLSKALRANDKEAVIKVTGEIIGLIDEGMDHGRNAVDKIQQARDMQINPDFQEYLRLKEEALKKQIEAFSKFRIALVSLRDNYDPQNTENRDRVKAVFEQQTQEYRERMEKARDNSSQANELRQEVLRRLRSGQ